MFKRTLYLECYSGISGDMTVAALLDLGADKDVLEKSLAGLHVKGFTIKIERTKKCGIDACSFDVILESDKEVTHAHTHTHAHRNLQDIFHIIEHSHLKENIKVLSKKMFKILAEAEAKAHGISIEEVHFHEVGAIDSIVDIIAVAVCVDNLGIEEIVVSKLYEGQGHVKCQHGIIPVPVPAVVNIVAESGLSIQITDTRGEMITPTGAAIAATLKTKNSLPNEYKIIKIGIGAGKKDFEKANILRAMLIEEIENIVDHVKDKDGIWIIESNIDDSNGEVLGYVMDELLKEGARDVNYIPIYMKKNRPSYMIRIICDEINISKMEDVLFTRTTTIGIRKYFAQRTVLKRETKEVVTSFGKVNVKFCEYNGEIKIYPEYESIKKIMDKSMYSYNDIYGRIVEEIKVHSVNR